MGAFENRIKRALYRNLPLDRYLRIVSGSFFWCYRLGLKSFFFSYEYPSFLKNVVSSGDVVVDIGANLGYYSWFFARYAGKNGKVYAVEPMQPILPVLRRNIGKYSQLEILPFALGAEEKTIRMVNDTAKASGFMHTGRNTVGDESAGVSDPELSFEAEMKQGSRLFGDLDRLDFVKCDIEGFEWVVLSEMEEVFRKYRPVVLVETGGENRVRLTEMFGRMGYSAYVLDQKALRLAQPGDRKDLFFIPEHKQETVQRFVKPCE